MRIGKMRQWLTFQNKTIPGTQDNFGAPTENFTTAFEEWGAFEPLGSTEFHTAWKRFAETTARFRIRFRNDIDPDKHRIVMTFDASPAVQTTWDIYPPYPVKGRPNELYIEAREIK